jgi:hypothetical protein
VVFHVVQDVMEDIHQVHGLTGKTLGLLQDGFIALQTGANLTVYLHVIIILPENIHHVVVHLLLHHVANHVSLVIQLPTQTTLTKDLQFIQFQVMLLKYKLN